MNIAKDRSDPRLRWFFCVQVWNTISSIGQVLITVPICKDPARIN